MIDFEYLFVEVTFALGSAGSLPVMKELEFNKTVMLIFQLLTASLLSLKDMMYLSLLQFEKSLRVTEVNLDKPVSKFYQD